MKSEQIVYTSIGGQALIEGVMMKGRDDVAIAVRKPDGEIVLRVEPVSKRFDWAKKIPFLRGIVILLAAMIVGVKAISYSSEFAVAGGGEDAFERWARKTFGDKADGVMIGLSIVFAAVFAFLLFGALPTLLTAWLRRWIASPLWMSVTEGVLKFLMFVLYIVLVSRLREIRRVFQYHGAEHKVIHNYESGQPISVENARRFSTLHPRCGTSFVFFVLAISIVVFSVVSWGSLWMRIALKALLFPVIAGVSYELIRISRFSFMKPLRWPGMMLQKLTTREPDDSQLEVAIRAFEAVLTDEDRARASLGESG